MGDACTGNHMKTGSDNDFSLAEVMHWTVKALIIYRIVSSTHGISFNMAASQSRRCGNGARSPTARSLIIIGRFLFVNVFKCQFIIGFAD